MGANLQQRIDRLSSKAALLVERYELQLKARAEAEAKVAELTARIEALERDLRQRDIEIERLRTVSVLAPDHRDVEATRSMLTGLVREIDKCINQLSS